MVAYLEREFGERALNGDKSQVAVLQAKIDELESQLERQRAAENSTADSKPKSDMGSEHDTDSDVSHRCLKSFLLEDGYHYSKSFVALFSSIGVETQAI
jgi:hypothetical protein